MNCLTSELRVDLERVVLRFHQNNLITWSSAGHHGTTNELLATLVRCALTPYRMWSDRPLRVTIITTTSSFSPFQKSEKKLEEFLNLELMSVARAIPYHIREQLHQKFDDVFRDDWYVKKATGRQNTQFLSWSKLTHFFAKYSRKEDSYETRDLSASSCVAW